MTARSIRVTLADMLDDLPGKNFDDFVDQLLDCGEEPRVRRNRVEGKSRLEVVDVLVSTFTETGAVRVSVEVLKQINCHEQANKLVKETSGQSSNLKETSGQSSNSGAAGVNTTARHGRAEKHFVDEHRTVLIDRVTNVASILDDLLHEEVISKVHYDEIMALSPRQSQMRKLYDPLYGAGRAAKEVFFKSLQAHENHLIQDLQKKE
uniref:ETS1-related protein n=1 Tax=Gasterosteus aculeatus aculeatus TaxID=481459 RepID=G3PFE4_GASAC